jgi:hypothetical protein
VAETDRECILLLLHCTTMPDPLPSKEQRRRPSQCVKSSNSKNSAISRS